MLLVEFAKLIVVPVQRIKVKTRIGVNLRRHLP